MMDGKSLKWREGADKLLESLARENKYVVADMLILFLESADYGLADYSPLGGVFKRARDKGMIKRVDSNGRQALWVSNIYTGVIPAYKPEDNVIDQPIWLQGFGSIDGEYTVSDAKDGYLSLKRVKVS